MNQPVKLPVALRLGVVSIASALLTLAAPAVHAGTAAFTAPAVGTMTQSWDPGARVNLGTVFTANSNIFVDSLGVWRDPSFSGSEMVGLYDYSTHTLLASTAITLADTLSNGYLYRGISSVALVAGHQYQVTAYTNGNAWAYGPTPTTDSHVTYNSHLYNYTNQLAFASNGGGSGNAYYGANLTFTTTAPVPEPESYAMMLGGLAALSAMARRRRARQA